MTLAATAAPVLDTGNPLSFFTNVASRLLATQLSIDLTRIQIYPTNQYTPAVHRLLQVAANVYDATTNRTAELGQDFPTVFRPLFTRDVAGNVFITGYTNVDKVQSASDPLYFTQPLDASQLMTPPGQQTALVNIYDVPWIIGAKKGFPSFNEISMQDVVTVTRKLQVTKASTDLYARVIATNAMYVFSISNAIGVEFWNSYTNAYTNTLQVVVYDILTMNLTNDLGFSSLANYPLSQNYFINIWPSSTWNNGSLITNISNPFFVPISVNIGFLANQVYQWGGGFLPANSAGWQNNVTDLTLPHFGLVTTNRLQAYLLATDSAGHQRVIDYVHFNGPNSQRDLNAEIQTIYKTSSYDNMWDTNKNSRGTTWGIASQLNVSQGIPAIDMSYWNSPDANFVKAEIYGFTVFMGGTPTFGLPAGYAGVYAAYVTNTTVQVPYTPTVTVYEYTSWQANDPLVHSLASDLNYSGYDPDGSSVVQTGVHKLPTRVTLPLLPDLGVVNARYKPWSKAQQPLTGVDSNPYNRAYKDPLVRQSDHWNFPNGQPLSPDWIGQVHRGSPWQTIFLKATNILNLTTGGITTWTNWTGNANRSDAINTAPVNDWHVASLIMDLFNTNNLASRFPVNNPDPVAWQGLLEGLTAYTNIPVALNAVLIASNSVPASVIASAIQSARATQPGHCFSDIGDILAAPQLAEKSPFLTGLNLTNRISDEAYEVIPCQLLSLLRADSIGSAAWLNSQPLMLFTGYDGHRYAIESSADLVNWVSLSTNDPVNGVFRFTNAAVPNANQQFFRSVLLQ